MNNLEDDYFISVGSFVEEMSTIDYYLEEMFNEENIALRVEQMEMETACQLEIGVDENDNIKIGTIPPMYYLETTFMPVFHKIKLNIEIQK